MKLTNFFKYQGLGNDFVLFDCLDMPKEQVEQSVQSSEWSIWVEMLCHRYKGVGADGVLVLRQASDNVIQVDIYNSDGSQAKFCGNGARCAVAHLYHQHHFPREFSIHVGVQLARCEVSELDYTIWIPRGRYLETCGISIDNKHYLGYRIDMGNPHLVIFDSVDLPWLQAHGPQLESYFGESAKTNVEFVWPNQDAYQMLVFERGAGITQACGSGAMASVEALCHLNKEALGQWHAIHMLGGMAKIRLDEGSIALRAEAKQVFSGSLEASFIFEFQNQNQSQVA